MEIIYREATASDAEGLLDYLKTVGGESDNLTFGPAGIPLSVEQEKQFLENMKNNSLCSLLLALDADQIVGNASIDGNRNPRFCHRCNFAISVRKDHWGQGIGSELLRRQIEFARSIGAEIISLEVRSDNERAKALYSKFGFRRFGVFEKFFKINGKYFDADYMTLQL